MGSHLVYTLLIHGVGIVLASVTFPCVSKSLCGKG